MLLNIYKWLFIRNQVLERMVSFIRCHTSNNSYYSSIESLSESILRAMGGVFITAAELSFLTWLSFVSQIQKRIHIYLPFCPRKVDSEFSRYLFSKNHEAVITSWIWNKCIFEYLINFKKNPPSQWNWIFYLNTICCMMHFCPHLKTAMKLTLTALEMQLLGRECVQRFHGSLPLSDVNISHTSFPCCWSSPYTTWYACSWNSITPQLTRIHGGLGDRGSGFRSA